MVPKAMPFVMLSPAFTTTEMTMWDAVAMWKAVAAKYDLLRQNAGGQA